MQKAVTIFLLGFIMAHTFGQTQRKVSSYLLTQYSKTLYNSTIGNNPWGLGFGLQTFFNNQAKF